MELPLYLRYDADGQHSVAGILICGASPADWLHTLTQWDIATAGLRFLVIDPSSLQVLVIGKGIPQNREDFSRLANSAAPTSVLPLGYRCVADRLYLPLEAELSPSVTEPELRQLLPSQVSHILVWHPAAGLMEFEPDQIPSAADLLRCPAVTETRFNGAGLGNMLNDRIRSLHPEVSDNPFDIIQQ